MPEGEKRLAGMASTEIVNAIENEEVTNTEVANTLIRRIQNDFSKYLLLPPWTLGSVNQLERSHEIDG